MIFIKYYEFCKILYKYKTNITSQSAFVVNMFKSANNMHFKKADSDDKYARSIFSGDKPITQSIRCQTYNPSLVDIKSFFDSHLNKDSINSIYDDFNIPTKFEKDFDTLTTVLAYKFIQYATLEEAEKTSSVAEIYEEYINNPKSIISKEISDYSIQFLLEMNGECPLCPKHNSLYVDSHGEKIPNFKLTHIFPLNISSELAKEFNKYNPRPLKLEDSTNIIALCLTCHNVYTKNPNLEDYKKLVDAKRNVEVDGKIKILLKDTTLEDHLSLVLKELLDSDVDNENLPELSFDAKVIKTKIPDIDTLTYRSITNTNSQTYSFIDKFLKDEFGKNKIDSTTLGKKIKDISNSLVNKGKKGKQVVEELIVSLNESLPKDKQNLEAIRCIVYYFLQHCEVLS